MDWNMFCGRKDAIIQELYHNSWKKFWRKQRKKCQNTGINKCLPMF